MDDGDPLSSVHVPLIVLKLPEKVRSRRDDLSENGFSPVFVYDLFMNTFPVNRRFFYSECPAYNSNVSRMLTARIEYLRPRLAKYVS